jgi:hypothetical protein
MLLVNLISELIVRNEVFHGFMSLTHITRLYLTSFLSNSSDVYSLTCS